MPAGLQASTFTEDGFGGTAHVYGEGDVNLKVNDAVSSIKVSRAGIDYVSAGKGTRCGRFNSTPMGVNSISVGSPHVRPHGANAW